MSKDLAMAATEIGVKSTVNEPFRLSPYRAPFGAALDVGGAVLRCIGIVVLVLGVFWIPLAFMTVTRWLDWLFGQMSFGIGVAVLLSPPMLILVTSEILKKNKFVN